MTGKVITQGYRHAVNNDLLPINVKALHRNVPLFNEYLLLTLLLFLILLIEWTLSVVGEHVEEPLLLVGGAILVFLTL